MPSGPKVVAWKPRVDGVVEVFHAQFTDHVYPMHTHDAWTLLLVDVGMVRYDLDRHEHGTWRTHVTLLPPHVPHNGSSVTPQGFRKRVLYLDADRLGEDLIGPAVDRPELADRELRRRIGLVHDNLARPGDELEAETQLALVSERLRHHLAGLSAPPTAVADPRLAMKLRELLDAHVVEGVTLDEAAARLYAHPTHLVRAFSRHFGLGPHRYLIGRRVDMARRLLLDGLPVAQVAAATGFHDQPHLTRHFKSHLGTSPARYARSGGVAGRSLLGLAEPCR